ncbi:MAG: hypothetical protein GC201_16340 [Alphaproteobacteria bacterium]|nr:hypothetical protein [Alphaproteobacteria bacterium]
MKSLSERIARLEGAPGNPVPHLRALRQLVEEKAAGFAPEAVGISREHREATMSRAERAAWDRRFGDGTEIEELISECRRASCPAIAVALAAMSPADLQL